LLFCDPSAMRNPSCLMISVVLMLPCSASAAESLVRSCAVLRELALPKGTVTVAEIVAAGMFTPPNLKSGEEAPPVLKSTPAFCRVTARLAPTADSDIKLEIWLPAHDWNGKFKGVGNGGFAGHINYGGVAAAVRDGYASASTDTGHSTDGAEWALGHPEKLVDYGYRAIHEMTVQAKIIVQNFYGAAAKRSYFASCSNGGRQALMEAQRFPDDYDGILAGAPANAWAPMLATGLKLAQKLEGDGYIRAATIPLISNAVLAACDELDGLKDGVLNDPRKCHFNPSVLLCQGTDSDRCLTKPQVDSLKQIYFGGHDASGKQIFPGLLPGAEDGPGGWKLWITGDQQGKSLSMGFVNGYFADMVYGNKDWDFKTVNVDDALKLAYKKTGDTMDAISPDLKAFLAHGGKLVLYHGWNDPAISAINSIEYYDNVVAAIGNESAEQFLRLYTVPGMQHCAGGPGASSFGQGDTAARTDPDHDVFTSLAQWVENGRAPEKLIATKYREGHEAKGVEMTRPLCPYPQSAKYNGGDPNSAGSFACTSGN
jgi:hypothetical protein